MKKMIFIAIVGAITFLLAACNNVVGPKAGSGHFKQLSKSYAVTFTPVEIMVSEEVQDTSVNDNGFKTITYTSNVYFLDSANAEYGVNLKVEMVADFTGKFTPTDLQSLKKTRQFFKKMTRVNPRILYIKYFGEASTPCLYIHKQIVSTPKPVKYINNAKVKVIDTYYEEDKSLIWQSTSIKVPFKTIYANPKDRADG